VRRVHGHGLAPFLFPRNANIVPVARFLPRRERAERSEQAPRTAKHGILRAP